MFSEPRAGLRNTVYGIPVIISLVALWRVYDFFRAIPIRAAFQFDYEEGNILNAIARILHGATPYPDPHALPSVINPYGPLAYYLLAIPAKLFGFSFFPPRAMILACALGIAAMIGVYLHRATRSTTLAVAFGLVFLTIPNIQEWAWLLRVDLLGIAFTFAGLVLFHKNAESFRARALARVEEPASFDNNELHQDTQSFRARASARAEEPAFSLVLPAFFFAAALLVKPTLVAAPAACCVTLLGWSFRRVGTRRTAILAAITFAVVAVVFSIFAAITRGAVITDVFFSHPDPFDFGVYTEWLSRMAITAWPLVLLAAIAVATAAARKRPAPAVVWLVLSTATAMTAGKLGSNRNHFLEWNTALCLCAGLGFAELLQAARRVTAIIASVAAALCILVAFFTWPVPVAEYRGENLCPSAYDWVRTEAGPNLLSENVGSIVMANKTVWVSNPFVLAQLVEHAGWSDAALVAMIRERRFDAILTRLNYPQIANFLAHGTERFSPAVIQAIADNYEVHSHLACRDMNVVFTPKRER